MKTSDKLNTFLPVFDWEWWQLLLLTFTVSWVAIRLIKGLEPLGWEKPFKKGGREIWWSGFYGDLFLPIGVTSSVYSVNYLPADQYWFTSVLWNFVVIVLGYFVIIFTELRGGYNRKQLLTVSKLWHTLIAFPLMFYLAFMTIIPLIVVHKPLLAVSFAALGYGVWIFTISHDLTYPPDIAKTH